MPHDNTNNNFYYYVTLGIAFTAFGYAFWANAKVNALVEIMAKKTAEQNSTIRELELKQG